MAYRQAHLRLDAGRGSVEELVDQIVEWLGASLSALSRHQRHSRQPRGARGGARGRAATSRTIACSCSAISSATAPIPTPSSSASASSAPHALIRGNHDKVGSGVESPEGFNAVARSAIRWTYDALTPSQPRVARGACPPGRSSSTISSRSATARRSTRTPTSSTISTRCAPCTPRAARSACSATRTCRSATALNGDQFTLTTMDDDRPLSVALREDERHLINPGSVGQPRDGDPRAGFAAGRHRPERRHPLPPRLPDRQGAGAHPRGRTAGGPRTATRAGPIDDA